MIPEEFFNNLDLYNYLSGLISKKKFEKIENLVHNRTNYILPILEDLYQFRNAGAIVRSMEAFGFQSLIALENRNEFKPESTVSRGADKWIDISYKPSNIESLKEIKEMGYQLVAVSPEINAIDIYDFHLTKPTALIFGTEFKGINEETLKYADSCIKIPMMGFTKSLNVSVAAGICFYEMRKKLEVSNLNWHLTEIQKLNLKIKWAIKSISSGEEIAFHYVKSLKK
ncbi:tRNA (guanosine-2'-O-)-methyltransferase [Apibacter mensalis]|uniref:tRNA (guanosine(18)-2'-O)-methyltransferase n=1 Tax=Apibacter mensalis TaxID=1586267 RepID=A0A0X3AQU6_9FLAO|nr:RNA methyltransferase [Apibacter mensalis]CVK16746.1 tRNA (guanosine-2'-O-)-methyltransferase [Apibacter mensalis]